MSQLLVQCPNCGQLLVLTAKSLFLIDLAFNMPMLIHFQLLLSKALKPS